MDMNTAFDLEVKQHCPQAEVVYDLFHVVAGFMAEKVMDRNASRSGRCAESDKPARKSGQSARWFATT